jgi:polyphosphate kinase
VVNGAGGNGRNGGIVSAGILAPELEARCLDPARPVPEQFINQNLSLLAFNARVLGLAEDESLPLLERVRFLAIHGANMDELFMVQVARRKGQLVEGRGEAEEDGLTPGEELDAVAVRARELFERAQRCLREGLVPALAARGIRILRWVDLTEDQRRQASRHFAEQIYPVLTPLAAGPGHPFPHISNLRLALAALVRDPATGVDHFAAVRVPESLPRFVRLRESLDFIAVEAVICANLHTLFPGLELVRAHSFRVTRSGDVRYDEDRALDLLQEIEEEVQRRPFGSVVRMEVERTMPAELREFLLQEFRFESRDEPSMLWESDVYECDWLMDLSGLREIAALPLPELAFPPFRGRAPVDSGRSVFEVLRERDVLAHHPYDAFESTVERFLGEAVRDADVLAIKVALYRTGEPSRVLEALQDAAGRGKEVVVLVELKARYDEERNIQWARRLEAAGIHVVYGLLGLKTHAKIALVVRREGQALRRYALVGTGNLNAITAAQYTDFALLSARRELGEDLHALFNALSGYSAQIAYRRLMVSPRYMLGRFVELIQRETEHARRGRGGRIRAKMNGLADPLVVQALYQASQAGVAIDLVIRGVCTLRPGVRGLSERIRVISILGRFLEHGRVFHFGNAGHDEYYIGSADWRLRNLRHRVEVVSPVEDSAARAHLDHVLAVELANPTAWELRPDGSYARRSPGPSWGPGLSAQERLCAEVGTAAPVEPGPRAQ